MKIELHAHSTFSFCGKLSLEELIRLYRAKKYDLLVLTNHFNRFSADRYAENGDHRGADPDPLFRSQRFTEDHPCREGGRDQIQTVDRGAYPRALQTHRFDQQEVCRNGKEAAQASPQDSCGKIVPFQRFENTHRRKP